MTLIITIKRMDMIRSNQIAYLLGMMIVLAGFSDLASAIQTDPLNTRPSYTDKLSRNVTNFLVGGVDSNHLNSKPPYTERVSEKLGRGVTNFFLGGYEFNKSYHEELDKKDLLAAALTTGMLKGAFRTAKRMTVGMYEFFTCIFPQDPIIYPEYVTESSP